MQKELFLSIKKIKNWIKKNNVIDVILFGSVVREKNNPNDIDLCIISEDEKKSLDIIDSLGRLLDSIKVKSHISFITPEEFISGNTLAKTLLNEGYSIKKEKSLSSNWGLENKSLFNYNLKNFSSSKRVRFHYMLNGRYGTKGILDEVNGKIIGTGSILIPTDKEDLLKEILNEWKVDFKIMRLLIS